VRKISSYFRYVCILSSVCCFFLSGCGDSVQRHKVLSLVFDGVPAVPPPTEEVCADIAAKKMPDFLGDTESQLSATKRSTHKPYVEKNCKDCHSSNKAVDAGLIVPKKELCFVCHEDFVHGQNVHGPVAVGDCLSCHLPHHSEHPSLLIDNPDEICAHCHQESRLAEAMHDRFSDKTISCGECHDPHAGDTRYFLK
jgi:predicted CXXCH cytochrome family protein